MNNEWTPLALRFVIESTWSVAYRRAYDEGYQRGVFARSGNAMPKPSDCSFTKNDLLKIEQEVALAYADADAGLMRPSAACGHVFNAIWARLRRLETSRNATEASPSTPSQDPAHDRKGS